MLFVFWGMPPIVSGGLVFSPLQVYFSGIALLCSNAGLLTVSCDKKGSSKKHCYLSDKKLMNNQNAKTKKLGFRLSLALLPCFALYARSFDAALALQAFGILLCRWGTYRFHTFVVLFAKPKAMDYLNEFVGVLVLAA